MTGEIEVTVYGSDFSTVEGTITTAFTPRGSFLRNEAGNGRFVFPIYDTPARTAVQYNRIAVVKVDVDGVDVVVAAFHIHSIKPKMMRSKDYWGFVVEVSGPGILYELTYDNLGYTTISDGSQSATGNWLADIVAFCQNSWAPYTMGSLPGGVLGEAYLRTAGETALDAILECIQQSGLSIAYAPRFAHPRHASETGASFRRQIIFVRSPSSGSPNPGSAFYFQSLTLVRGNTSTANQASIHSIELIEDTHEVATRVTAYGAGIGADVLTIADAQGLVTVPTGFSVDWTNSVITNTTLEAATDQPVIHRLNQFGHIKSEDSSNTTANETAAVQLFWAAINYLRDRQVERRSFYRVKFVGYSSHEYTVGQSVHLTYNETSPINSSGSAVTTDVIDVDDDLVVHELHMEVPHSGPYKGLRVITMLLGEEITTGTFLRPLPKDEEIVVRKLKEHDEILRHATASSSPSSPGGSGTYATADAPYLVLSTTTNLTNERQFVAGAGLAAVDGGANSTYTVNVVAADTSLTINADSMQVRLATTSGLAISSGLMIDDSVAGAGLAISSKVLAVGAGDGIDVAANAVSVDVTDIIGDGLTESSNNIELGTPGTLTVSSSNAVTASSHTHAVTTSSDPTGASILASDSNGRLGLEGLGIGTTASADAVVMADDTWIGLGASAGRIVFDNQSTDQIEILDAQVLVGGQSPDSNIVGTPSATLTVLDGRMGVSSDGDSATLFSYAYGTSVQGGIALRSARGTRSSPSATQSSDNLGRIGAGGHTGSAFQNGASAFVQFVATENWTGSAQGGRTEIHVTPNGSTTSQRAFWADEDGVRVVGRIELLDTGNDLGIDATTGSNANTSLTVDFPDVTSNVASVRLFRNTNTSGTTDFVIFRGDGSSTRDHVLNAGGGYVSGGATGGDKGVGTINISGDVYQNNTAYTHPDYALEAWRDGRIVQHAHRPGARNYRRLTLGEVEDHIRANLRLPGITGKPAGLFERGDYLLEKVEELFTYVIELNHKLEAING